MAAEQILMSSGRPTAQPPFHDCALSKMCFCEAYSSMNVGRGISARGSPPLAYMRIVTNDESGKLLETLGNSERSNGSV